MKGLIAAGMMTALLASAGALLAQTEEPGVQLFATAAESGPVSGEMHTVVRGETLWGLADRYYGDPFQWGRIYSANLLNIADPDRIYPNKEISVPELTGTAESGIAPNPGASGDLSVSGSETAVGAMTGSEEGTISGADGSVAQGSAGAAPGRVLSPGRPDASSRYDLSLLSEEIPTAPQEWTGDAPKIVPGNWKGDGVIVSKFCDGSDSMQEGLTETGDRVLIKTRTKTAFKSGDILGAYMKGAAAYDTKTGRELGVKLQKTGILRVISVSGKKIIARVVSAGTSVDQGQQIAQ